MWQAFHVYKTETASVVGVRLLLILSISLLLIIGISIPAEANPSSTTLEPFTRSLALDGTGDYVEVADDPALELHDVRGFTLEAWVLRERDNVCESVIGKGELAPSSWWLGFCPKKIAFTPRGGFLIVNGSTDVPVGGWTHIAVVWEGGGEQR